MKLFLNIYDFFRTAVIKVLLTITEAERNVHRKKWGCLDVVILGPVQIIQRSSFREQDANACAGAESEHRVHVTDRSTIAQQRGIKETRANERQRRKHFAPQAPECVGLSASIQFLLPRQRGSIAEFLHNVSQSSSREGCDIIVQVTLSRSWHVLYDAKLVS